MRTDGNAGTYVGSELELFAEATNWKEYLRKQIEPYLGLDVLEVGAGLGGTTRALCRAPERRWVCLEPDPELAKRLRETLAGGAAVASPCEVIVGTLASLSLQRAFDSLLYVDVLEHIEQDREELARAGTYLRNGGHVIVLSPAHPFLYTPFDKAVGHYRRYTRSSLRSLQPPGLKLVRLAYLDSVGLLASLGNLVILRRSLPTVSQIAFWDGVLVPASTLLDRIFGYRLGKSLLGVWRREPTSE